MGATGAIGSPGAAGTNGATGTANVIYSNWITPSTYTKTSVEGTTHFDANITASAISQSILDNGSVIVYAKLNWYIPAVWPTNQVSNLPISITYQFGGPGTTIYNDV